jgi:hypothetical protein
MARLLAKLAQSYGNDGKISDHSAVGPAKDVAIWAKGLPPPRLPISSL